MSKSNETHGIIHSPGAGSWMDFVQSHTAAVTPPKHLITTSTVWEVGRRGQAESDHWAGQPCILESHSSLWPWPAQPPGVLGIPLEMGLETRGEDKFTFFLWENFVQWRMLIKFLIKFSFSIYKSSFLMIKWNTRTLIFEKQSPLTLLQLPRSRLRLSTMSLASTWPASCRRIPLWTVWTQSSL